MRYISSSKGFKNYYGFDHLKNGSLAVFFIELMGVPVITKSSNKDYSRRKIEEWFTNTVLATRPQDGGRVILLERMLQNMNCKTF